jgi:hypothetical protein
MSKPSLAAAKPEATAAVPTPAPAPAPAPTAPVPTPEGPAKLVVPPVASGGAVSPTSPGPATPDLHFEDQPVLRTNKLNHVRTLLG